MQSAKSLKTWQQAQSRGDKRLRLVFGTKGGRARDKTVVRRDELARSLNAVVANASENGGKLVDKAGLRSTIAPAMWLRITGYQGKKRRTV